MIFSLLTYMALYITEISCILAHVRIAVYLASVKIAEWNRFSG